MTSQKMQNRHRTPNYFFAVTLMFLTCAAVPAYAKDYKVEIIVFKNLDHSQAYESYHYEDVDPKTSNSQVWDVEASMLLDDFTTLEKSASYQVLNYYSWGQESLPVGEAAAVEFTEPNLTGWIKVYANNLLYINLDLDYEGYRLNEKRRIKLDEKHFFDHPKFGVLTQVSRLEVEENAEDAEEALTNELQATK